MSDHVTRKGAVRLVTRKVVTPYYMYMYYQMVMKKDEDKGERTKAHYKGNHFSVQNEPRATIDWLMSTGGMLMPSKIY